MYKYLVDRSKFTRTLLLVNVVMSVVLRCFASHDKYAKLFKLTNSDLSSFIIDLSTVPPKRMRSLFECAAYTSRINKNTNMDHNSLAFKYVNETCSLARASLFIDDITAREVITDGSPGYHVMLNKPKALLFSILINEEKTFLNHRDLGTPNPAHYDDDTKYFNFDLESPVKTLEGHLAGTPVNSAYLSYSLDNPLAISDLSVAVWFYTGSSLVDQAMVNIFSPSGPFFLFKIGSGLLPGSLQAVSNIINGGLSIHETYTPANFVTSNTWHHFICTYTPSTGQTSLYTNGNFTISGTIGSSNLIMETVEVGHGMDSTNFVYSLNGYVANVEIYDKILTGAQVMESFEKGT